MLRYFLPLITFRLSTACSFLDTNNIFVLFCVYWTDALLCLSLKYWAKTSAWLKFYFCKCSSPPLPLLLLTIIVVNILNTFVDINNDLKVPTCRWFRTFPATAQHSAPIVVRELCQYQAVRCQWRCAACNRESDSAWFHISSLCCWFVDNLNTRTKLNHTLENIYKQYINRKK